MYKSDPDNKTQTLKVSMYLIFITFGSFIAFTEWHSQWMLPVIMACALLIPMQKSRSKAMLLMTVFELLFILQSNMGGVSVYQVNYGIFPKIIGRYYEGPSCIMILNNISSISPVVIRSALCAVIIYLGYIFYPHKETAEDSSSVEPDILHIGYQAKLRIFILSAFIVFYLWCYWYIG